MDFDNDADSFEDENNKVSLKECLKQLATGGDVHSLAEEALELISISNFEGISEGVLKMALCNTLFEYPMVGLEAKTTVKKLAGVLMEEHLQRLRWDVNTFWSEIGFIVEISNFTFDEYVPIISSLCADWVSIRQEQLESIFFSDPVLQSAVSDKNSIIIGYSELFRAINDDLVDAEQSLSWSDDFIVSLYKGTETPEDKMSWVLYSDLPETARKKVQRLAIQDEAYQNYDLDASWFIENANTPEEREELVSLATAYGYTEAEKLARQEYPLVAKYVEFGRQLGLSNDDIYQNLLSWKAQALAAPNDIIPGPDII